MRSFIERIDIYPEKPENGCWIRNIVFNFPMPVKGKEITALPLESEATVETVCLLGRRKPDDTIKVSVNMDDYYQIRDAEEEIRICTACITRKDTHRKRSRI